ncbi:MAG: hypothetical protein IPM56_11310 [Ignavibacteriales bacterium]|nr:MAG: hypothetical protein IPM56_11310 [Ignavibacteriales bacterium]
MRFKRILIVVLPVIFFSFTFSSQLDFTNTKSVYSIKKPQKTDYDGLWEKVDSLEQSGLSRSALEIVEKIYKRSKKENVHPQFIKSVLYKLKFANYTEENSQVKIVNDVKKEISDSEFPSKAILKSILADMYWQYYRNNRYKYQQRTETVNFDNEDFLTWDLNRIVKEITRLYLEAISEKEKLQKIPVLTFEDILDYSDTQYSNLRPTLYDVLAHEALIFFNNEESSLTQPVYKFILNSPDDFSDAEEFIKINYSTQDSLSLKYYAIKLYQDLIQFHLATGNREALLDIDVARLNFVLRNSVYTSKRTYYFASLQNMSLRFAGIPHSSIIWYNIAKYYKEEGAKYDASASDQHKWDTKRALEICDSIISTFPDSYGTTQCDYLKREIFQKSIEFQVENANIEGQPFRALITYKNVHKLFFRVIKLDEAEELTSISYEYYREIENYLNYQRVKEWTQVLPNPGDYQKHRAEVIIPALPAGRYMILAATDNNFVVEKNAIAYARTWVTNIGFLKRELLDGKLSIFTFDRKRGLPIGGVKIKVYSQYYDDSLRKYRYLLLDSLLTNDNGETEFDLSKKSSGPFKLFFLKDNDRFASDDLYDSYYRFKDQYVKTYTQSMFFTDRSIYRPGQTVYFKGLMYQTNGDKEQGVLENHSSVVSFYDANMQKITDTTLTTNEFGTFNGKFVIPFGKIGGFYTLMVDEKYAARFRVEEYKRPKFEVKFEPVKGSYSLNDKVKVTGVAQTFSGANLNDVEVKYRVVRNTSFPYYSWRWRNYYIWCRSNRPATEIINGITKTDAEGRYTIEFETVPDLAILRETNPEFSFSITADVVDVTGETHSAQTNVIAGYISLMADVELPEIINQESNSECGVSTKNLNGTFEPATVKVEVYKLKTPERIFRKRLWEKPDTYIYSKDEYYSTFDNDSYSDEAEFYNWEKELIVFESSFLTKENSKINFDNIENWKPGKYELILSANDKNGTPIKLNKYFTLFNPDSEKIPLREASWFYFDNRQYEPGETAAFYFGSALNNVNVYYELEQNGIILESDKILLNDEQKEIEIKIEEEHRGNIAVQFWFTADNEFHQFSNTVFVPWTNKNLNISFETFRNKMIPGKPEEWKLKISDADGDEVSAEVLASMYDMSLDKFTSHNWGSHYFRTYYSILEWRSNNSFTKINSFLYQKNFNEPFTLNLVIPYPTLNRFGFSFDGFDYKNRYLYVDIPKKKKKKGKVSLIKVDDSGYLKSSEDLDEIYVRGARGEINKNVTNASSIIVADEIENLPVRGVSSVVSSQTGIIPPPPPEANFDNIKVRTNLNETAFFYPELRTNEDGEVIISFTSPEALTRWKFMAFAHTKDMRNKFVTAEAITQKDLMVLPHPPRFLREGDEIFFTARVTNLAKGNITGAATLQLFDAFTMQPVDNVFGNVDNIKSFNVDSAMSKGLEWKLKIPVGKTDAIVYRVLAKSGDFSDGEENSLPIIPNRMLVTETLPLPVKGKETKTFVLEKMKNNTSSTLQNYNLSLEFTSNPAWYAIQALPYLMEYPYECNEQTFSKYYANSIASHIVNTDPKIKEVFKSWETIDKDALLSNLEKNQELKNILLEETPWVLHAQNESERKKRIALLFDLNKMSAEKTKAEQILKLNQYSNGGWSWFKGCPDSWYITQYIVSGMGHLDKLGIKNFRQNPSTWEMVRKAVYYTDARMHEYYMNLKKYKFMLSADNLTQIIIQYLYGRSYFIDLPVMDQHKDAFEYWKSQAVKYWLPNNKYMQGMIALALYRFNEVQTSKDIIKSILENAVYNDEMGMYFKQEYGWYWYESPIESQALLIEAFNEITNDQNSVDQMKTWLLKQKQVQDWKTTKATAEACYALLLRGSDWLAETKLPDIIIGGEKLLLENNPDIHIEDGTGYFKTSWKGDEIKPEMSNVTVTNNNDVVAWGSLYWQYFEQLDKITQADTKLKVNKKLFLELDSEAGKKITPVDESTKLKPGDKIIVRIEIRVDRDMEYVHLKDMRASGFEPINVLSTHKYQDGLWHYENTRDFATNFFIERMPKGTYVFEYPLRVNHKGDFSNGITTLQCMYAPEFSSHSEGIRVIVE